MLKGYYRLGDITVDLSGYEFSKSFLFYLSCPASTKKQIDTGIDVDFGDGDISHVPSSWSSLYLKVDLTKICVPRYTIEENGQVFKNDYNRDFFKIFGSILRGFIKSCNTTNCVDSLGGFGFNPSKVKKYEVMSIGSDIRGKVELDMGSVVKIHAGGDDAPFELFLEEDYSEWLKIKKPGERLLNIPLDLSDFTRKQTALERDTDKLLYSLEEIIERNPDKNFSWIRDMDFEVVTDFERMKEVCQEIWNHDGLVAFDTETTGLNFNFKCETGGGDRLVGMVFSIREGQAWYFPVAHKKFKNICTEENEYAIIEEYFKPILEHKPLIGHNISKFDWKVMYTYGIDLNVAHDTIILYQLTLAHDNNIKLGLKPLTKLLLGRDSLELSDFIGAKWGSNDIDFSDLPMESVKWYACPDDDNVLALFRYAMENSLLEKYGAKKVYELEVMFGICIAYQEYYGHCTDMDDIELLEKDIERDTGNAYNAMKEICGRDFSPNSPQQLSAIMYDQLGYPVLGKTDTGNPSTGGPVREKLIKYKTPEGGLMYPFAKYLDDYKTSNLLKSNFTKNLPDLATDDGFMFSEVEQFLATGRVSCKKPNYQSYNNTIKKYIRPRRGFYMLDADFSSVEYRILANMAGQEKLIEEFVDPDMDYHSYQASRMFSVPIDLVSKELRSQSKGVNFGLAYGMGDPSLGKRIFGKETPENTRKASKLRKLYFEGQEKIELFFERAQQEGINQSYSTTHFGRRRYFDKRQTNIGSIKRQASNNRIQGTAADLYKYSVVRLFLEIRKRKWYGLFLFTAFVHDELVSEVHNSINPVIAFKVLRECFMIKIDGWCDLYIGAGFGRSWYEAKSTEMPVQVQESILERYGEEGLPFWDGDMDKVMRWEVDEINNYKRDRIISAFRNPDKQGKVFVFESGLAHDVLADIKAGKYSDGVLDFEFEIKKDLVENLAEFARVFGVTEDFLKCDPKRPDDIEVAQTTEDVGTDSMEEELFEEDIFELCMAGVRQYGVAYDSEDAKLYFKYSKSNTDLMVSVENIITLNPGVTDVYGVSEDGKTYDTGLKVSMKAYRDIFSVYATAGGRF
jgi:DNA polymerase-1